MSSFMHIFNHIHIFLGQDIVGIVRPLEEISGSKIHGKLQLGKRKSTIHTEFHIMTHDNKFILFLRLPEITGPAAFFDDSYDLFIIRIGKHTFLHLSVRPYRRRESFRISLMSSAIPVTAAAQTAVSVCIPILYNPATVQKPPCC